MQMTDQPLEPEFPLKPAQKKGVSKAAFRRLPHYHQIVSAYEGLGRRYISSKELSQILDINETLVRKDMADLEIRGRQNQGYAIEVMKRAIEDYLGLQDSTDALIIGAGHLGKALALYHGFEQYGLRIAGILDNDPGKIGSYVGPHEVLSVFRLASTIERKKIKLIVLTVPRPSAQEVTDIAVGAGVRAIWNFTPTELRVPEQVRVRNEQIIAGFMTLSYFLKNLNVPEEIPEAAE
ncbi:MAG: redox-sensing transcriptional repressor Rex [Ignavibacteria bacterium]|nr:redox-sensing transcriptional repressor Rex [Ignavibacteria bacterium]